AKHGSRRTRRRRSATFRSRASGPAQPACSAGSPRQPKPGSRRLTEPMGGPDAVAGRPRETGGRNSRRRLRLVLGFSAAALAAIVYANGLAGPFVYDDHITVLHNPSLTDLS